MSHNAGERWERIGKSLDDDFGFVVATAQSLPGRAFFVPLLSEPRLTSRGGFQVYQWNDSTKKWKTLMPPSRFPGDCGTHREGMACDALDPAGIYVGTTTGQLFFSPDAGASWSQLPFQFPAIHSVSVACESPMRRTRGAWGYRIAAVRSPDESPLTRAESVDGSTGLEEVRRALRPMFMTVDRW